MPPLPSPGKVVKLECAFSNEDASGINLFYLAYTGNAPSPSDLSNVAGHIEGGGLIAAYDNSTVSSFALGEFTYTDLSSSTGSVYSHIPSHTSTLTGDVLPASASVCVSKEIARRYRGGHPRSYFMFGSSTTLAGTSLRDWQTSFLANVQTDMDNLLATLPYVAPNQTWTGFVNVSYRDAGAIRVTPVVDPITAFTVRTRVCSQRRRLGKVGG